MKSVVFVFVTCYNHFDSVFDRYSSPCENESSIHEEVIGNPVRNMNKFQRKYRSSVRRISSSFKNKAMKSITNEQRASKVSDTS